ncbi:MAG TPA: LLM class F420-dependent oxidoreductase [Acidimicrobiales bacterium]|nr:LLM class F420-dependent oxidoreductase [Acidimicrobiales bacterium]
MQIGLFVPLSAMNTTPDFLRALGPAVEERGFESVWVPEHVVLFDEYSSEYPYSPDGKFPGGGDTGLLEPLTALTYLAAVTDRIRLGTAICLVPQRNPVYTAKQVADLDLLSGGRVDFGMGIGWLREEYDALNVPFAHRGRRMDEYLQVIKSLWTEETSSFSGDFYDLKPCRMYPKPVQLPHPPLHVGGESDAALRRAARFGQGWFTFNRTPDQFPDALDRLDRQLAEAGRSRNGFAVSVCPYFNAITPENIEGYRAAGVDRIIAVCFAFARDDLLSTLDQLVSDVLEPARAS